MAVSMYIVFQIAKRRQRIGFPEYIVGPVAGGEPETFGGDRTVDGQGGSEGFVDRETGGAAVVKIAAGVADEDAGLGTVLGEAGKADGAGNIARTGNLQPVSAVDDRAHEEVPAGGDHNG